MFVLAGRCNLAKTSLPMNLLDLNLRGLLKLKGFVVRRGRLGGCLGSRHITHKLEEIHG